MATLWDWFPFLVALRILYGMYSPIMDCDETFNYWEPLHYVTHHSGLQPWEYSPDYALRSWGYIFLHKLAFYLFKGVTIFVFSVIQLIAPGFQDLFHLRIVEEKIFLFKMVRVCLGVLSAFIQTYFCDQIQFKYNNFLAKMTFIFLALSPGINQASVSILPNSFLMHVFSLSTALWIKATYLKVRKDKMECIVVASKKKDSPRYFMDDELSNEVTRFLLDEIKLQASEVDYGKLIHQRVDYFDLSKKTEKSIQRSYFLGLLIAALPLFFWPYAILGFLPFAASAAMNMTFPNLTSTLLLGTVLVFGGFSFFDTQIYGVATSSMLNQVSYNVLGSKGPNLYGEENWLFYIKNLLVNFNILVVFAGLGVVSLAVLKTRKNDKNLWLRKQVTEFEKKLLGFSGRNDTDVTDALKFLAPLVLVIPFFTLLAHKEERFLFQVYPLICFAAAIAVYGIFSNFNQKGSGKIAQLATGLGVLGFILMSISRNFAVIWHFSAPVKLMAGLAEDIIFRGLSGEHNDHINICYEKEWYRFPSSFFLPEFDLKKGAGTKSTTVSFLKGAFDGMLPQEFGPYPAGLQQPAGNFNDRNEEVKEQYKSIDTCDFIVDFDADGTNFAKFKKQGFEVYHCEKFLNAEKSTPFFRSFYIPVDLDDVHVFSDYCVLKPTK